MISVLSAMAAAAWSMLTWQAEQQKIRDHKRDQMSAQYVNTLILATQELQHRLYKILEQDELSHYRSKHATSKAVNPAAVNLLYHFSCFFGWSLLTFRFGPYTRDPRMIAIMAHIGAVLESRNRFQGEAFRFTLSERVALGDAVVQRIGETQVGPAFITISEFKFEDQLAKDKVERAFLFNSHQVECTLEAIDKAIEGEQLEGRDRLAVLQNLLVDLLDYLEQEEGFRVHVGERDRVPIASDELDDTPVPDREIEIVHHIDGRLRLSVPALRHDWDCAARIETALCGLDNVLRVRVNPRATSVVIEYSREASSSNLIKAMVAAVRYEIQPQAVTEDSRITIHTTDARGMTV